MSQPHLKNTGFLKGLVFWEDRHHLIAGELICNRNGESSHLVCSLSRFSQSLGQVAESPQEKQGILSPEADPAPEAGVQKDMHQILYQRFTSLCLNHPNNSEVDIMIAPVV